ncbi:hypothetical protein GCM10010430_67960 [Kitasatospora cystarginea]|uniref:Uncharacterized protein n=1 Tax=Kitasatospora cystarginea TaxID=58350 RepID=A0ABP5RRS1_9ACTN
MLSRYFLFLELRRKVEIHRMTGRVVKCPVDEPPARLQHAHYAESARALLDEAAEQPSP